MEINPREPLYFEIDDRTLRDHVEVMFSEDIRRGHSVAYIIRLNAEQWLVKLSPSITKQLNDKS